MSMYLKLLREPADGKSVRGVLYQVHFERLGAYGHSEKLTKICDTLENRDYLIPPLIYRVTVTMSPKFKRLLPVLCAVPATPEHPSADGRTGGLRSGIRIHRGFRPEHSEGCILVPGAEMEAYVTGLLARECRESEVRLEISEKGGV